MVNAVSSTHCRDGNCVRARIVWDVEGSIWNSEGDFEICIRNQQVRERQLWKLNLLLLSKDASLCEAWYFYTICCGKFLFTSDKTKYSGNILINPHELRLRTTRLSHCLNTWNGSYPRLCLLACQDIFHVFYWQKSLKFVAWNSFELVSTTTRTNKCMQILEYRVIGLRFKVNQINFLVVETFKTLKD
jgi:hypothetical protein